MNYMPAKSLARILNSYAISGIRLIAEYVVVPGLRIAILDEPLYNSYSATAVSRS
jgi:hypothetical protein